MSDMKWTTQQLEAITERGRNLLVAAAAGAGKTAVLVERIIRRITDEKDPVDIDFLLVVTFTNAAATEMRERVGDALEKALDKNPGCTRLQRQLSLLNKATITTMHSFCLETIRNNFHCIDIDPVFRVADETETVLMKLEALEEMFEDQYQSPQRDFLRLVECYGGQKDDGMLQQMVLDLYHYVQSHPWPENWLGEAAEAFNLSEDTDFGSTRWAEILVQDAVMELRGMLDMMREAIDIINGSAGLEAYLDTYLQDIGNVEELLGLTRGRWDDLHRAFMSLEFGRLPRCGRDADPDIKEHVKGIRDEVKGRLKRMREGVFRAPSAEAVRDLRGLYPLMGCLAGLVMAFERKYSEKKREKSVLDFNDLEHYCLEILTGRDEGGGISPSGVALAYRQRFAEILVDEYQDSNLVQEVIVNTISGGGKDGPPVFVVGDVKQSIYRFRQARPELFLAKYNRYPVETGKPDRKIMLYKNFRSREGIIKAVNRVFGRIMSQTVGELDYTEDEALNPGAGYPDLVEEKALTGGPVEVHIIDRAGGAEAVAGLPAGQEEYKGEAPEGSGIDEEPDAVQAEAVLIAGRIKEMMNPSDEQKRFKVYDRRLGRYRDVEYRDIVVLLRATRNWAEVFMEEFDLAGIPVYADTSTGYFGTVEVGVIISLLQIIDNPMQDIPLLAVLKSPIGVFTPEELMDIRLYDREASFYQAMKGLADNGEGNTAKKASDFLDRLDRWRDRARHMSTDVLLWYLFADTNFYSFAGTMPGGEQRQANLRMLYERARQYEETSYRGLFNFINFINNLKSGNGDLGSARVLGENENVVRIMSIHKSKGLEFPVVIVAGCGKGFNFQDMTRRLLVHQDLGFGPDYIDPDRRVARSTLAKQAVKCRIKLEMLSEEMRILYVAFTRAREKLIITGSVRDLEKAMAGWNSSCGDGSRLAGYRAAAARSYFDWLGPCLNHGDGSSGLGRGIDTGMVLLSDESKGGYGAVSDAVPSGGGPQSGPQGDSDCWVVKVWNKRDITRESFRDSREGATDTNVLTGEREPGAYMDQIAKRLEWEYRYKESANLPVKLSVTELKRRVGVEFAEEYQPLEMYAPPPIEKPSFMDESKGFSSAEKGSILHFVMQHLSLEGPLDREGIEDQVAKMVTRELLTRQEAEVVDAGRLEGFFCSPLGQRMLKSGKVRREVPFNLYIRCTDVYGQLAADVYGDETILLQGVIDCFFEEDGKIVLIDYKTDYVNQGDGGSDLTPEIERIRERYRIQIEHYASALQRITGKPVAGKFLYLFHTGDVIEY
ncbi:MAG: helicase-exonuclease AddAB subunit AddA [Bacillota bacterium]